MRLRTWSGRTRRGHGLVTVVMEREVSGGGQRVVAELGQDVAGLPEDLAGLGHRGALAAAAVLDGGVVAVVRGRGPGVGLARLLHRPAQHRRSLAGKPPGRAPAVPGPDGDDPPREPDPPAGGRETGVPRQPARDRPAPGPATPRPPPG